MMDLRINSTVYVKVLKCLILSVPKPQHDTSFCVLYLLAGKDITLFKGYELTITLRGLERLSQHVSNMAPTVTTEILLQLVSLVNLTNPVDVTFMSPFLCMFSY